MKRLTAKDFPQEVLELFTDFSHGVIDRRTFLNRAAKFAIGSFTAAAMLEALRPNYAWAQQIAKDDPRLSTEYLQYESPNGDGHMRGYFARPKQASASHRVPGVVVIHENRGLTPYIEDVCRRLAVEGFAAFAPDALSSVGGYPGDDETGAKLFAQLDPKKRAEDLISGFQCLKARAECNGTIGAVGFCFGGEVANTMAVRIPELKAVVSYYGVQPPASEVPKINAALQLHYAGLDNRVNAGWPAFEQALKANHVRYEMYMYPGAQHAFHNDTGARYDEAAAKLAWSRTITFFDQNLRAKG
ncbi:MAG TPA: dienelactone hydrolase family protein [Casimicrobiaceae bacterium]|nr:dienelactone hydrolase family protein [Casimicrobiaceae bacterium]